METSLLTLQKRVEKETAQGHSWDTVVQLLTLQALTEVSSRLETLSKVLSEILEEANGRPSSTSGDGPSASGSPERAGGIESGVQEHKRRGRPRKGSGPNGQSPS